MTTSEDRVSGSLDDAAGGTAAEARATDTEPATAVPSRDDAWIELLTDADALDRRRDLFDDAFAALAATVRFDPGASDTISRVIERRLAAVPNAVSLGELTDVLRSYLGVDAAYLVHWLAYASTVERLVQVEAVAPQEVTYFLRRLLAENGAKIDLAQRAALLGPDDWVQVFKNAYYDVLTGRYMFNISVLKLDGSTLQLECTADSLLRLTNHLLELVNSVSGASVYSPAPLELFAGTLAQTAQLVGIDRPDGTGDEPLRGGSRIEDGLDDTPGRETERGDLE